MSIETSDENIKCTKSPFGTYEGEVFKYKGTTSFYDQIHIQNALSRNQITPLDFEILNIVYLLRYSTTRQITEYLLNIKNISDISQEKIRKRLVFLRKRNIISYYEIMNEEENKSYQMQIYTMTLNGKNVLKSRNYDCHWDFYEATNQKEIKQYLARNQFFLKAAPVNELENFELRYNCSEKNDENILLKFNSKISSFNYYLFVIRKNSNLSIYKSISNLVLKDKLAKVVLLGESDNHIFEVYINLIKNNFDFKNIIFSQDLRLITRDFNNSFINFILETDNKVSIKEIALS